MANGQWQGKNILVLGLGDSGLASIRWLARRGARLSAADTRAAPPSLGAVREGYPEVGVVLGAFEETLLEGVDTVVASPGVALREPVLQSALRRGIEVVGDVEIFAREVAHVAAGARVLGVTGTNGKSTVTALAGAMGRRAGYRTVIAGNIGLPVLEALESAQSRDADLFVIELSSYQLETTSSLRLDAATMLNLTQDHMDRYDSMAAYARAKERIFRHARARVLNRDDDWSRAMQGENTSTFGLGVPRDAAEWGFDVSKSFLRHGEANLMATEWMAMKGLHNAANGLAAHALLTAIGAPNAPLVQEMREFKGLRHRLELVAEAHGVRFYDDSKGTNVGATVAALEGFSTPVVLIAGGDGKGQDFAPLEPAVRERARCVVLIGRDAPRLAEALQPTGVPMERADSMEEAVEAAFRNALRGDSVLLSPACASLDMFRNFGHRGDVFAAAARKLSPSPLGEGRGEGGATVSLPVPLGEGRGEGR